MIERTAYQARIERAAKAIKCMVDLTNPIPRTPTGYWTEKGLREVRWPRDFSPDERRHIRAIARAALTDSIGVAPQPSRRGPSK
jgi:hypothetical protein